MLGSVRRVSLGIAAVLLGIAAVLAMLVAGPWVFHHYVDATGNVDVHDAASLPGTVHACGRDFRRANVAPMTFEQARQQGGVEPKLVDTVPFAPCPAGWCENGACDTVVFVRVGVDAIVPYELRGGP
jgi:hypothetical protein